MERISKEEFDKAVVCANMIQEHIDEVIELDEMELEVCAHMVKEASIKSKFFFDKYVLGFTLLTEETHLQWELDFQRCIDNRIEKLMRLKPRATYKTTVYSVGGILWLWACISQELRIFFTSANAVLLEEVSDQLDRFLNPGNNTIFQRVFGIVRDKEAKNTGDVYNLQNRGSGKGFSLIMRSAGSSTNGVHPQICICDDPLDRVDRESATIRKQKERWFESLIPLMVPFKFDDGRPDLELLMVISTRWHAQDLCDYIIKQNEVTGEWDIESESIYNSERKTNYPEFITDEKIASLRGSISSVFFSCQYENSPLSEDLQVFSPKMLHYVPIEEIPMGEGKRMCFFDPAKGSESGDWPAVIFTVFHEGVLYLFDAIDEKIPLARLLHVIAAKNRQYGVSHMVFESNSSSLIKESLLEAHKNIGYIIQIEDIHHRTNKEERIINMQPQLYSGFLKFRADWDTVYPNLMEQLTLFPAHQHDDFPDVIEMSVSMHRKPSFEFIRYESLG